MIGAMRSKWGPKVIGGVIAVIAFVFIFYGIFVPGSSSSKGPGVAGEVNGEAISYTEFSRALNQRVEFFKNMMGGKVSDAQLEQFHIGESVFQDLAQRKVVGQVAKKEGFYPSSEEIRDQIMKMDVFKKDGRFDKVHYKTVLNANQLNPVRFEEMIGQEIMEQNFKGFLGNLAVISSGDVEAELRASRDKHKIKYLYLDKESARKLLPKDVKPAEEAAKLSEKTSEVASAVLPILGSGSDAKVNSVVKMAGVSVKTSEWLTAQSNIIPGVGSLRSIQEELFKMKKGSPAQKFELMGGTLFAVALESETYDPKSLKPADRSAAYSKVKNARQGEILKGFVDRMIKEARVSRNDHVVGGGKPVTVPFGSDL